MKEKSDTVLYLNSLLMHEGGKNLQTNARGHVTTCADNGTGELLSTTVDDGGVTPAQSYTYDQWGRQTFAVTAGVAS